MTARTFGVEIEVEFPDAQSATAFARALYDHGLSLYAEPRRRGGTLRRSMTHLAVERDPSLDPERGIELITPPTQTGSRDAAAWWDRLDQALGLARRHGARVTDRTAMHVHVGVGDLGRERAPWAVLVRAAMRRFEAQRHAMRQHADVLVPTALSDLRMLSGSQIIQTLSPKRSFLSTAYLASGLRPTVEVRWANSTLDLSEVRAHVADVLAMVDAAAELARPVPSRYRSGISLRGIVPAA